MVAGLLGKAGAGAVSLVAVDFKHACALALIHLRRRVELCVRELVLSPNPATRITVQSMAVGPSGGPGAAAVSHVVMGHKCACAIAPVLLQVMAEHSAWDLAPSLIRATVKRVLQFVRKGHPLLTNADKDAHA